MDKIPVFVTVTSPIVLRISMPNPGFTDVIKPSDLSIFIPTCPLPLSITPTPVPVKLKSLTSLVIPILFCATPIPADTTGTTHWLSPRRNCVVSSPSVGRLVNPTV